VDLAAVIDRYGLAELFRLAAEKDPGFSIEVFSEMLGRFGRLRQDEFGLEPSQYEQVETRVTQWRDQSRELAHTIGQELGRDHRPGL
jgi:hypothetical protein